MATIPLYNRQTSAQGLVQVDPSRAGGLPGQALEGVGQALGQASRVAAQAVGQAQADDDAMRMRIEEKRLADIDFQDKAWASRTFAEAQRSVVDTINQAQRGRQQGQVDTASTIRKIGEEWRKTAIEAAPSENAKRYAQQNLEVTWASAERAAMENDDGYRTDWGVRQFQDASEAQQIAIQDAPPNMVDDAFLAAAANTRESLAGLDLDPETKRKLGDKILSESVQRAGTRIIQAEGPDKFLDIIQGVSRTRAGSKKVTRPGNGRWSMEIQQASEATGVDPTLIEAVMQVESGVDDGATSAKGALGLMQLMPGTAKDLGVDPTKPEQNIMGGARYLAQLLKRYGGDEEKAIAAYNAGMGNVDKAKGVPNFKETREYVQKVRAERDRFKGAAGEMQISREQIPAWWEFAKADDRDRLIGTALRMQQEMATANLQYLGDWKKNADAAQSNGLPVPPSPSWETVVTAHAGDEVKARRYWEQNVQPVRDVADLSSKMAGMTIAEMDQQIEAIRPKAERANDPSLAADFARVQAAEHARREIMERRSRDPMAQALQQPAVKAFDKDRDKQIAAALAWQKENVPEGKRTILQDKDRRDLEAAWSDPQNAGPGLAKIEELQSVYGQYFDDALMEIAPKAPADVLLFAGMNVDPKTAPARQRIRALASKTLDEVIVGNESRKKLVVDAVARKFQPFYNSFKQTNQIEGAKYVENIGDAVVKYAASLTNAGLDPKRAAARAFDELVGSQYGLLDGGRAPSGRAQVRAPRNLVDDDDLRSKVEDGLEALKERPPEALAFPVGVNRADGLDDSYWATATNDRGVVLMFRGAPVRVQRDGKLVPFELSWNAVANAGERFRTMR